MKIGIDARLWSEGGVGRYIRNLTKQLQALDKSNDYVLFVLPKDYNDVKFQISNFKFQISKVDIRWHSIEEQFKFANILNKEELDLVHFPYISVPMNYQKPFVVTIHDLIPYHYPSSHASTLPAPIYYLKLLFYKLVVRVAAKKAKKIIAPSSFTKKEIIEHLKVDENKIIVTYEGIDGKISNHKSQIPNKKCFLYVGNAFPHKNLERLLEAFNVLDSNPSLVFVGKDDYFCERLKEKVEKMKLSEKVIFLQNVNDEELSNLYQNALALVMPSLMEGFGLPALEAMANKCLVLASNIPSLKEVCDDAAIYFDPYDIKDIEEKMREVCFNDLNHFSEKIEKGLERAKLFSWRKMAKETLAVYEQAASNP